jgi:nitrate/nitrite-specific signal transduction histidine kinase
VRVDLYFERVFGVDIKDEGIGFDGVTKPVKRTGHHGLVGMRERAAEIHGSLVIESSAQAGTRVRLTIPVALKELNIRSPGHLKKPIARQRHLLVIICLIAA